MAERVLLLQGPVGPFFGRFARELEAAGCEVWKINLNGGDAAYFRGPNAIAFCGRLEEWRVFLERALRSLRIDRVYVFGDTRVYHRIAREVAHERGVRFFVFEEGYLRPDYITLEEDGVNGESRLPRDPEFYRQQERRTLVPEPVGCLFGRAAWYATVYYVATALLHWRFPHYLHHRRMALVPESLAWVRSIFRKLQYRISDDALLDELVNGWDKRFFLVPLQVHCDAQVVVHSPFRDVSEFIETVARSFARHAPRDRVLVFKHHPLDRAYRDYGLLMRRLAADLGLGDRLRYAHDLHLPTLFKHAEGVVAVNSTAGTSALYHGVPTKVLGEAVYDIPGLTSQAPLDAFWSQPGCVDRDLYCRFATHLAHSVLANGSFYRPLPGTRFAAGIRWWSLQNLPHSMRFAHAGPRPERVRVQPLTEHWPEPTQLRQMQPMAEVPVGAADDGAATTALPRKAGSLAR